MESAALNLQRMHVVRIDPGEDVLLSVKAFACGRNVSQAVVVNGYGTLAAWRLHWVVRDTLPSEFTVAEGRGGAEILGMSGLIVAGEPHIHVSLSNRDGAFGGHLEERCIAYVVCEIFLAELNGTQLSRQQADVDVPGMGRGRVSRLCFGG